MRKLEEIIVCQKCIMDNENDPDITFDKHGVCSYCNYFEDYTKKTIYRNPEVIKSEFDQIINFIKEKGKNKEYDCIIGLSGGVDSTFLAFLAKENNLRALLVHFDNGWNSEIAVSNIEKIVKKTGFDLISWVIDWELFKDIQRSYLLSSVVDIEVPTDQFITAALYNLCVEKKISILLNGKNIATESILPSHWVCYDKLDDVNLKDIHKKFGNIKNNGKYPKIGRFRRYYYEAYKNIHDIMLLNYVPFEKNKVVDKITEEFGWCDYGGKHYESIFTRFYQGYILPKKFNIDKRKAHYSNLILSNQIKRGDALKLLKEQSYPMEKQDEDFEYVCKKLNFKKEEFGLLLKKERIEHEFYKTTYTKPNNFFYLLFQIFTYFTIKQLRNIGLLESRFKFKG